MKAAECGGSGSFVGTTAGALALAVLAALLPILGLQPAALEIVYGCVILGAVALSSARKGQPDRTDLSAGRSIPLCSTNDTIGT